MITVYNLIRIIFISILLFSIIHLVRDVLQIVQLNSSFTNIFHRQHLWCADYCNYVTLPLEIFHIIGSLMVLKEKRVGILGISILLTLPLWSVMQWLP